MTLRVLQVEQPAYTVVADGEGYSVRRYTDNLVRAEVSSADWPGTPSGDAKFGNQVRHLTSTHFLYLYIA